MTFCLCINENDVIRQFFSQILTFLFFPHLFSSTLTCYSAFIIEILNKKPNYEGKIDIDIFHNNDYIVTAIKDNGEGILDTKKVMTPYFTTKIKCFCPRVPSDIYSVIYVERSFCEADLCQ